MARYTTLRVSGETWAQIYRLWRERQQVEIAHDQTNSTGRLGFPEWADQYIASKVAVSIQKMGVDTPAAQV